ncbi:hypothetical protein [Shewanella surugensis]|uniref:Uncharacterized protein n=1 Tax=Shewanella surugensis TaxID=212020 RepID=A0ABT0L927_9GAMM|nr:hypothetical protein [Shewanella surugensis]MCL1124218.1 hypothetical protein [Shewanella surugensis]
MNELKQYQVFFISALVLGGLILSAQAALSYHAMRQLSEGLPVIVVIAMVSLVVLFECVKPLLTFFIKNSVNWFVTLIASGLLLCLSGASIFAMHYTMDYAVADKLSVLDQNKLDSLNKQEEAYLKAVAEHGVVSATESPINKITEQRNALYSPGESGSSLTQWAICVSVLTELVIIACFAISAFFHARVILLQKEIQKEQAGTQIQRAATAQEHLVKIMN